MQVSVRGTCRTCVGGKGRIMSSSVNRHTRGYQGGVNKIARRFEMKDIERDWDRGPGQRNVGVPFERQRQVGSTSRAHELVHSNQGMNRNLLTACHTDICLSCPPDQVKLVEVSTFESHGTDQSLRDDFLWGETWAMRDGFACIRTSLSKKEWLPEGLLCSAQCVLVSAVRSTCSGIGEESLDWVSRC